MIKLTIDYIKKDITTSLIASLINYWETDRCAEAEEYLYYLDDTEDFKDIVEMYAIGGAVSAHNAGAGWWWGGMNFPYNDEAMCDFLGEGLDCEKWENKNIFKPFICNEKTIQWILGEIEDRITDYLAGGLSPIYISKMYGDIIDVKRYADDCKTEHFSKYDRDWEVYNKVIRPNVIWEKNETGEGDWFLLKLPEGYMYMNNVYGYIMLCEKDRTLISYI